MKRVLFMCLYYIKVHKKTFVNKKTLDFKIKCGIIIPREGYYAT